MKTKADYLPTEEVLGRTEALAGRVLLELTAITDCLGWLEGNYSGGTAYREALAHGASKEEAAEAIASHQAHDPLTHEEVGRLFLFLDRVADYGREIARTARKSQDNLGHLYLQGIGDSVLDRNYAESERQAATWLTESVATEHRAWESEGGDGAD